MPPNVLAEGHESAALAPALTFGPLSASSVRVRIPLMSDADIAAAEEHGRRLASRLDFSPTDITVIATAILEVARNVLTYAQRGDLMLHLIQKRGSLARSGSRARHSSGPPMKRPHCRHSRTAAGMPC